MFYKIKSYGKFLLKSTNQHGVHSPFVYNLVTKCFYDKTQYSAYKNISNYKKNILNKSVSCTLNGSATYKATDKLLFRLTQYFKPKNILELYTASGINTYTMSLGNPNAHITTIESCLNTSRFTKHLFTLNTQKNINIISVDCNSGIKNLNKNTYDFIVFNKKKDEDTTLNTFKTLLQTAQNDSVFIFTNIHSCKEMTEAWKTIKLNKKVTVTIDTFFIGLVFFRKEQAKEDFIIRV